MVKRKVITAKDLKKLSNTLYHSIKGYEKAEKLIQDDNLKTIVGSVIPQRTEVFNRIIEELDKSNEDFNAKNSLVSTFHLGWMDLASKIPFLDNDVKILEECIKVEEYTSNEFDKALQMISNRPLQLVLETQKNNIEGKLIELKHYKESFR